MLLVFFNILDSMHQTYSLFRIPNQIDERTCPCPCRNIPKNKIDKKPVGDTFPDLHRFILEYHFDPEFPFTSPPIQPQMTGPAYAGCQSNSTVAGFERARGQSFGDVGNMFFVYLKTLNQKIYGDEESQRYQQTLEFLALNCFHC